VRWQPGSRWIIRAICVTISTAIDTRASAEARRRFETLTAAGFTAAVRTPAARVFPHILLRDPAIPSAG
jgi:hypothetical protein